MKQHCTSYFTLSLRISNKEPRAEFTFSVLRLSGDSDVEDGREPSPKTATLHIFHKADSACIKVNSTFPCSLCLTFKTLTLSVEYSNFLSGKNESAAKSI
jgi:hypothetical protein